MRTLYLVRHAKAVVRKNKVPDFQRTLVKVGEKNSLSMARKMKKLGAAPDLLMSSTANRALETAHLFAKGLNYPVEKIMVRDALYNEMSAEALLDILRQVDDSCRSLMMFGHNPAFTDLASHLIRNFSEDIPKTGIVGIEFDKASWKDIRRGSGRLTFFEYPKKLAKSYKQMQRGMEGAIQDHILEVLMRIDDKATQKSRKMVRMSSRRIVEDFLKNLKASHSKAERKALAEKRKLFEKIPAMPAAASASSKTPAPQPTAAAAARGRKAPAAKAPATAASGTTRKRTRTRKTAARPRAAASGARTASARSRKPAAAKRTPPKPPAAPSSVKPKA